MASRTTHRSGKGAKLYAKRTKAGEFEDVQSFKRAHGSDVKRKSKAELASASKGKKTAGKKKTARKTAKKK